MTPRLYPLSHAILRWVSRIMDMPRDVREKLGGSRALLAFHWDADGISSAALLLDALGLDAVLYTPVIGLYRLVPEDLPRDIDVDALVVADMGVSTRAIERVAEYLGVPGYVFDHHHREPSDSLFIARYIDESGDLYPSASMVITDALGIEPNTMTALGIAGDLEEGMRESRYYWVVERVASRHGLRPEDFIELSRLVDTNYLFLDREGVIETVHALVEYSEDPKVLLGRDDWRARLYEFRRELERLAGMELEEIDGILFRELDSRLYIVSKLGRLLSRRNPDKYVLLGVPRLANGYSQVYLRTGRGDVDLRPLIERLRGMGLYAGGKRNVLGAVVEPGKYRAVLGEIFRYLGVPDAM